MKISVQPLSSCSSPPKRFATDSSVRVDVVPTEIHQRVPVVLGSAEEVARVEAWYAKG